MSNANVSSNFARSIELRQTAALHSVIWERVRQDKKFGEQNNSPLIWLPVLAEELGELSEAVVHTLYGGKYCGLKFVRAEAVQVAAVALAFVECLDRARWSWDVPRPHVAIQKRALQKRALGAFPDFIEGGYV